MNFQNLEYFVITAKVGNITRAAEQLNITQQALSGSISRLEQELSCTLFQRRPELELTYAGKAFLESADQMLDLKQQSAAILADINGNQQGELKIGVSHTRGQAILPMLLPRFAQMYPGVELIVTEASTRDLEKYLESGTIDVMIGFMPAKSASSVMQPLLVDRMVMVVPKTLLREKIGEDYSALCERYRRKPDIALFEDFPFILLRKNERIRTRVDRQFEQRGVKPKVKIELQNIQTAFSLTCEGMGISIIPEMYLKSKYTAPGVRIDDTAGSVEILPFIADSESDTLGIGYNGDRYLTRFAADFIKMSTELCREMT